MKGSGLTEDRKKAKRDGQRRETRDLNSKQGNLKRRVKEKKKRVQVTWRLWWRSHRNLFFFL